MRKIIIPVILGVLSLVGMGQESLPTLEELEARASRIEEQYPWLVQERQGLYLKAYQVVRDEFLRGLSAATGFVFDGTDELPTEITLFGLYDNIDRVMEGLRSNTPYLQISKDTNGRKIVFALDQGLKEPWNVNEKTSSYKRVPLDSNPDPMRPGIYVPGLLVVDGSPFPSPLQFNVIQSQEVSQILVTCNARTLEIFEYADPVKLDLALAQATNPLDYEKAVIAKLNYLWTETSHFPVSSTRELLTLTANRANGIYGAYRASVSGNQIRIDLIDGKNILWNPSSMKKKIYSEMEAWQKAYAFQNEIVSVLGMGGIYIISTRFGNHVIQDGYRVLPEFQRINQSMDLSLRDREMEIRRLFPEHTDWLLELLYTSCSHEADDFKAVIQPTPTPPFMGYGIIAPLPTVELPAEPNIPSMSEER